MAITLKDYQQTIGSGLQTYTYTTAAEALFTVNAFTTFNPSSGITCVINQNGSPVGPSSSSGANLPGEINMMARINCQVGDVITIVIASSLSPDPSETSIKTVVSLRQGV
jgi:hypothetical protein